MSRIVGIVPAYDPPPGLSGRLAETLAAAPLDALVVVDDGCQTPITADDARITVLRHDRNRGKGAALKTAFAYLAEHFPDADGAVSFDADGQHGASDVAAVCRAAETAPDRPILGVRQFADAVHQPWRSRFGNALTRIVFRLYSKTAVADTQTGLRYYPRRYWTTLADLSGRRYEYELAALLVLCRGGGLRQVPVAARYEAGNPTSHFRPLIDSLQIYWVFVRFSLSSILCGVLDYGVYALLLTCGLPLGGALGLARTASLLVNFSLNRSVVFRATAHPWRRLAGYLALAAVLLAGSYGGIRLLGMAGVPPLWAKIPAECLLFVLSFTVQRNWIFFRRDECRPPDL